MSYDRPNAYKLLGQIYAGDPSAMERWVIRDGLLHHLAPLLIGAALLAIGIIALTLWRGRGDSTLFLLLAVGTLLWGVQQIVNQWPTPVLPPPHQGVLILSMYIWYPMLLAVFFMRFAYVRWRMYELGAAALALLARTGALRRPIFRAVWLGVDAASCGSAYLDLDRSCRSAAIRLAGAQRQRDVVVDRWNVLRWVCHP